MPAVSQKQQKFMGLVLAYKRGEIPASKVSKNVKQVAASMSEKELEKYAGTKHKGLPKKIKEVSSEYMKQAWSPLQMKGTNEKPVHYTQLSGDKFPNIVIGKDHIVFVKVKETMNSKTTGKPMAVYAEYFRGHLLNPITLANIDSPKDQGLTYYSSPSQMKQYLDKYVLSGVNYEKFKNEPEKQIPFEKIMIKNEVSYMGAKHKGLPTKVKKEVAGFKIPMEELQKIVQSAVSEVISESVHDKKGGEEEPKFTPEEKKEYMEAIAKFNEYGKHIYRSNKLVETAKKIKKIVEFASKNIMDESGDWFDKVILTRHSKKMNESLKMFEKTAEEMSRLQQRMEALYEEIGETLGKYYDIK